MNHPYTRAPGTPCVMSAVLQLMANRVLSLSSPAREWLRTSAELKEALLNARPRFASYFDLKEVQTNIDFHARGVARDWQLFLLLNLHHWLETFA
jgi:hypothetical protein